MLPCHVEGLTAVKLLDCLFEGLWELSWDSENEAILVEFGHGLRKLVLPPLVLSSLMKIFASLLVNRAASVF